MGEIAAPLRSAGTTVCAPCRKRLRVVLLAVGACSGVQPACAQDLTLPAVQRFFALGNASEEDAPDWNLAFSADTAAHVNLGKLEFSTNNGVGDTFFGNGASNSINYGGIESPTSTFFSNAFTGNARAPDGRHLGSLETAEAAKITYTSPAYAGFNAGFSYTLNTADSADSSDFRQTESFGIPDNLSFGLGYQGDFQGVGLQAAVIGAFAKADAESEDKGYGIGGGLALDYSGFVLAAGVVWDDLNDSGGQGWATDLGIGYGSGAWHFALNGIYSKDEDSSDGLLGSSANIRYNLAPGVNLFAIGYLGEEELGPDGTNDTLAISSGIRLSF